MYVTKLEPVGKKKNRLYIDEERYALLYLSEVRKLNLQEGQLLEDEKFQKLDQILLRRSKMKVMTLLQRSSKTKYELQVKLRRLEMPEHIIEQAIAYVESYHYIDDELYVHNYISYYGNQKTKRRIQMDLYKKGISTDLIEEIWSQFDFSQDDLLEREIEKRIRRDGPFTRDNFQKNFAYFARKGFSTSQIYAAMQEKTDF